MKKYNSNYVENSKKPEYVGEVVEELIKEEINTKPYDFLFRFIGEEYPQLNHEFLDLPGLFNQLESTNVFTKDGKSLQMDLVESIIPDGKNVKYAAITNMEHQARKLSLSKIEYMFFYAIFLIGKFKQPCFSYVVTNIDHGATKKLYYVDGHPFLIHFILFDKKRIYKFLNILNEKNYIISQVSEMDFMTLNYCIIFAKEDFAKDVIETCVKLFVSIENISFEHQLVLFMGLKTMIKFHFRDNMDKTRELLTMITKAVSENMIEEMPLYQRTRKRLLDAQDQIQKDKKIISEMGSAIAEKDNVIAEKDEEIALLKEEIKSLKK